MVTQQQQKDIKEKNKKQNMYIVHHSDDLQMHKVPIFF